MFKMLKFKITKLNNIEIITAPLILLFIFFGTFFNKRSLVFFENLKNEISNDFGWFYILSVSIILIFVLYLAFSKYGKIKLGAANDKPHFSYLSWISMLFSAGMGIGLVFWGVGEPIIHYLSPLVSKPQTALAAKEAMNITFFHWGIHQWSVYVIVALVIAFFAYNHNQPLSFRTMLYPLLGKRINGLSGDFIDSIAIIGTLFGLATSLGFGAMQINSGLNYVFDVEKSKLVAIAIILILGTIATLSAVTGLKKGVKLLSETNLYISISLMIFFLIFGSTLFILNSFVQTIGSYPSILVEKSFWTDAFRNRGWIENWTIFYWSWVISWAPFVGIFIAKISYGRTIKEFVLTVLFVPTIITFMWISIFGGTALDMDLHQGIKEISNVVNQDVSTAIFMILEYMPLSGLISLIFLILISVYFVTSCDSGILVINSLTTHKHEHQSIAKRIFWGLTISSVAAILIAFGGLESLQTMTIVIALPFLIIMLLGCVGIFTFLKKPYSNSLLSQKN